MSALPDVPGVLRLDFQYGGGADVSAASRSFWSYTGTAPTNTTLNSICASAVTSFSPFWQTCASDSSVFEGLELTDLTTPSSGRGTAAAAVPGTRGTTLIPFGAAAVIDFKIPRRYRGGKPRNYFPLGIDTDLTGGFQWTGSAIGAFNTFWADIRAVMLAAGISGTTITNQVAVSYYSGFTNEAYGTPTKYRRVPTLRGGGPVIDIVTAGVCAPHVGSQRRRNQSA